MYHYRPEILAALLSHGVRPGPDTPPRLISSYLNDLYRFELRRLRSRLLRGEIRRPSYAGHVVELRDRYPLLSLPTRFWLL